MEAIYNGSKAITQIYLGGKQIKSIWRGNTLVYEATEDWEVPVRLDGLTYGGDGWNNNGDIPLAFDKNNETRVRSGGGNGYYGTSTITINLPYEIRLTRGNIINGVADRNGVGLINNFQIWTDSSKKTPLTNYETIARSNQASKTFNVAPAASDVRTKTFFIEFWGDGWKGVSEIYLYGKRFL